MQDFRYSKEFIAWKDLFLLLEGETVKLPAPKNHFSSDIEITGDTPIFATGKEKVKYKGNYNMVDDRETAMMDSRWRYIKFTCFPRLTKRTSHHVECALQNWSRWECKQCFLR